MVRYRKKYPSPRPASQVATHYSSSQRISTRNILLQQHSQASIWSWSILWYSCQDFLKSLSSFKACLAWNCFLQWRLQPAPHSFDKTSWMPSASSNFKRRHGFVAVPGLFLFNPRGAATGGSESELSLKDWMSDGSSGLSVTTRCTGMSLLPASSN